MYFEGKNGQIQKLDRVNCQYKIVVHHSTSETHHRMNIILVSVSSTVYCA